MSELRQTRSTCPYCGVGCGVVIESRGDTIVGVQGDAAHPANFGRLCSKGQTLHLTAEPKLVQAARALHPMRRPERGGPWQRTGWDEALASVAQRLAEVHAEHGPDAIGLYISGQLLTEDYYVFNKLAKGLLGTNNIDTNSRLCMSSAVAGYKATLGADAPPACYDDIARADTVYVSGSNMAWAHPVLFRRLEDARRTNPQQRLVVVDPRRTETAAAADLHLQLLPGSDVALSHGLLHLMLWEGWTDNAWIAAHTRGFDALRQRVREFTPRETARLTGLAESDLIVAARWFAGMDDDGRLPHTGRRRTLSMYCQGLNQSQQGTANNAALINLHLACGQIGTPGAGPLSLTGQPNAMGGREVGGMATLLSAHRDLDNPAHRAEVAALWGVSEVPARAGKAAIEMFEAAAEGRIKALWIACTNPAQSLPDQALVRRALERCEFVVLQEAYRDTATAAHADWLLPASSWGEKEGTVTNSERRISRVRAAIAPAGEARADWAIAVDVAHRLEAVLRPGLRTLFPYRSAHEVWLEHRESTRGRDLDITGLSWAQLESAPQSWPCPEGDVTGRERLYEDGRFPTADGRAAFADVAPRGTAESRDARRPFSLITGRLRDQWHGMSRTGTLPRLFGHAAEAVIELHPQDMGRLRVTNGDLLRVASARGCVVLPARASDGLAPTQAFIAMHWGDEFLAGGVNLLTTTARCPKSLQPELKHSAVRIEPAALPWRLLAATWCDDDAQAHTLRQTLRGLAAGFDYLQVTLFGHGRAGVLLQAAASNAPAPERIDRIANALALEGPDTLHYRDIRQGLRRSLKLMDPVGPQRRLEGLLLAGDIRAGGWMLPLLQARESLALSGAQWLAAPARSPASGAASSAARRQVCTCLNVSEERIVQWLAAHPGPAAARYAGLQAALQCGTQCGSCTPELRRYVAAAPEALAPVSPA